MQSYALTKCGTSSSRASLFTILPLYFVYKHSPAIINTALKQTNKQSNKQKLMQQNRAKYGPCGTPIWLIPIPSY